MRSNSNTDYLNFHTLLMYSLPNNHIGFIENLGGSDSSIKKIVSIELSIYVFILNYYTLE